MADLLYFSCLQHSQYESFDQNDQSDLESTPGNFEVLDSSSISKSGSFGPNEQIFVNINTDEITGTVIPTPIDSPTAAEGAEGGSGSRSPSPDEREKIELTVLAGKRCFVPLVVAGQFYELSWEFTSAPKVWYEALFD